ncbi:hypothetical protein ACLB2K_041460 [Fragaria x ananassa]
MISHKPHNQGSILNPGVGFSDEENNDSSSSRGGNRVCSKRSNRRKGKGKAKAWLKQVMNHDQTNYTQANAAQFHANILDGETLYEVQIHRAERVQVRRHGGTTNPTPPNVHISDLKGKGKAKAWLKQVMNHDQTNYTQANAAQFHANILDGEILYEVQIHRAERVQVRRHGGTTNPTPPNVHISDLSEQDKDEGCDGWPGAATDQT